MRFFFPLLLAMFVLMLCYHVAAGIPSCYVLSDREFDGSNPLMDLVQEPVRHLGHMSTKICSTCKLKWTRANFHGSQWAKRDNRMCMRCVNRRDDETTAAAPGIPVSLPEGQHGAHTSAAAAGAGAVEESSPCCQPMMCRPVWSILDSGAHA